MIVGLDKFSQVDIRVRVSGGGHTSQVYAVRQAIAKALIAYYQKYVDERKSFPRPQVPSTRYQAPGKRYGALLDVVAVGVGG